MGLIGSHPPVKPSETHRDHYKTYKVPIISLNSLNLDDGFSAGIAVCTLFEIILSTVRKRWTYSAFFNQIFKTAGDSTTLRNVFNESFRWTNVSPAE